MKSIVAKIKQSHIIRTLSQVIFKVIALFPVKKGFILFESFSGKQYSCNPRAIYEYMNENDYPYKYVWSVNGNLINDFSTKGIPVVKRHSFKWFLIAARAEFWITNSRMPSWLPKPTHTTYIQTWHGTPLKKLVADMKEVHLAGNDRESYIRDFHKESMHWDYLISANKFSTEIFKRAFNFNRQVLEVGYPRNDVLVNGNDKNASRDIKKRLQIPADKKVILYAPTWRDHEFHAGSYTFSLNLDIEALKNRFEDDCVIILRLHYFVSEQLDTTEHPGFIYDFSKYVDINDLYLISDLLITDYSSVIFDYANLKRPMIFYTYDLELYREKLRGFYFDLESNAPGPIARTNEDLIKNIDEFIQFGSYGQFAQKYNEFFNRFCYLDDGKASKRTVEYLFNKNS
ncbi:CDP-glycerol glycerophosphotransferase family protein [Alkalihalobacillus pseudalcaliphilus]|uniref:CDP-glycerol glycerophosphotransferase family protein n=1 Tax=Alkalihalobacillus pseudalcaliphilus TaxID=79884 RepID=UPI00064DAAB5|nr:CDP-glycerol glycerophosphotransferase family protein [Alkalihalobacillus pseudalcaliphilus]KMK77402.1 CDP-glycerol:glycerophosphate glycerophosphotransferase [Alkalihalobacillus pseudalcaliphilus]